MVQIKICGITSLKDARHAAGAGADALGFIFYPQSPRYVSPAAAREIITRLPQHICRVGVFVNEEESVVRKTVARCRLDMIQLHGDETPDYCRSVAAPEALIKALPLRQEEDLRRAALYPVAAILVDSRDGSLYGGTGKQAAWELAARLRETRPLVLAGGLHRDNIRTALGAVRPRAVDINSGVETAPGKKDPDKVTEIIRLIREAEATEPAAPGEKIFRRRPC